MSFFVELPVNAYPCELSGIKTGEFNAATAHASMWVSQLAYEAHRPDTLHEIKTRWNLTALLAFIRANNLYEARGLIAEHTDAVFVAFSGTDPAILRDLVAICQFWRQPRLDVHYGFYGTYQSAVDYVAAELADFAVRGKPLIFTGHSLGAAIAALMAEKCRDLGLRVDAVYLFGMPRVGGARFRERYESKLGKDTYRLVHSRDLIPHLPPGWAGYSHVGKAQQFQRAVMGDPGLAKSSSTIPDFLPNKLKLIYSLSPKPLRDHFPASYCDALDAPDWRPFVVGGNSGPIS